MSLESKIDLLIAALDRNTAALNSAVAPETAEDHTTSSAVLGQTRPETAEVILDGQQFNDAIYALVAENPSLKGGIKSLLHDRGVQTLAEIQAEDRAAFHAAVTQL